MSPRRVLIVVLLAALCSAGSSYSIAAAPSSQASELLLLSPKVATGQQLSWLGHLETFFKSDDYSAGKPSDSHFDEITCKVLSVRDRSFTATAAWSAGYSANKMAKGGPRPPSVYASGQALKADSTHDTTGCKTYASWRFGEPPAIINAGSSWTFVRPDWAPSVEQGERGVTTILSVDALHGVVRLRTEVSARGSILETIEATMVDGGIESYERSEYHAAPGSDLGPYTWVDSWTLLRP